jgi:hypothetical protein
MKEQIKRLEFEELNLITFKLLSLLDGVNREDAMLIIQILKEKIDINCQVVFSPND